MFDDEESVFARIGRMISARFEFLAPVWIVNRPESLTIVDYRPTFVMLLAGLGFISMTGALFYMFFRYGSVDTLILCVIGAIVIACLVFLFRGSLRESYYFDKSTDSYAFVRQHIHRQEVIQGALSQFTGAFVKTERNDDSESHFVMLKQGGMLLTGVDEQRLREEVPIFNSSETEERIASAIGSFVGS